MKSLIQLYLWNFLSIQEFDKLSRYLSYFSETEGEHNLYGKIHLILWDLEDSTITEQECRDQLAKLVGERIFPISFTLSNCTVTYEVCQS